MLYQTAVCDENGQNRHPHLNIWSPISVTNIDVTANELRQMKRQVMSLTHFLFIFDEESDGSVEILKFKLLRICSNKV